MIKRFQNKVATGRTTLPITVVYAVVMLLISGLELQSHWIQILMLGVSTYLMVTLNNSNALIRVFSRLVSCSFLAFTLMVPKLQESISGGVVQLLFIIMLLLLFKAYQDRRAVGTIFYAFLCIGGISTQFIQILFFVPFIWILMFTSLQMGSLKVLVASIFGLILPYWFWTAYCFYEGYPEVVLNHILSIAEFGPLTEGLFTPTLFIPLLLVTIIGIIGTFHFLSVSFSDNIKTRMFYNVIMTLFLCSLVFIILQPQHEDILLRLLIITVAPLAAHFFTFTNSWLTNMSFYGVLVAILTITVLNTWFF